MEWGSWPSFFLVKVEAVRIEDSLPAPFLTLIVGPSEEGRKVGETKKELSERYLLRYNFWAQLLERARDKTKLHSTISPGHYGWIGVSAGKRGLNLNYSIRQHEGGVELYIDRGKGAEKENRALYDKLATSQGAIEKEFGGSLLWEPLENRRACRISHTLTEGGYRDEGQWPQVQDTMIDAMIRLEGALRPYLDQLPV